MASMNFENTLPIIQSLWIGERLSIMEKLCISSFLKNGHPFHLYIYDHVKEVPPGTVLRDAHKIIPSSKIFKCRLHSSYTRFADLFRYKLLLENGSYWVDMDIICLKPLQSKADYIFPYERIQKKRFFLKIFRNSDKECLKRRNKVNNCLIKAPVHSAIMEYCYEIALKKLHSEFQWGDIAFTLLTEAVKRFNKQSYVVGPEVFCPIDWWDWRKIIDDIPDSLENVLNNSQALHLWNEMWRGSNIDKDRKFPDNCLYEKLKRKFLDKSESE